GASPTGRSAAGPAGGAAGPAACRRVADPLLRLGGRPPPLELLAPLAAGADDHALLVAGARVAALLVAGHGVSSFVQRSDQRAPAGVSSMTTPSVVRWSRMASAVAKSF